MAKSTPSRESVLRALAEAGRRSSTETLAFHRRMAVEMGLNETDHKCLDILIRDGPMLAGDLAERGGYTTGAVTGIVNRLENKGLVRRTREKSDGRRVLLKADAKKTHRLMWPLLQPLLARLGELHARYETAELKAFLKYMEETERAIREARFALENATRERRKPHG